MARNRFLILCTFCLPLIVGCDGCRDDQAKKDDEKEKQAPIEDFTARAALTFPADSNPGRCAIKPGHWITGSQTLKSNKVDVRGDLVSRSSIAKTEFESGGGITHLREGITSQRPIVLPKGQERRFDYRLLVPSATTSEQRRLFLNSRFMSAGRSTFFDTGKQPFAMMVGEEYFFVILTSRPERFARFQVADWVRPPKGELDFKTPRPNYRIVVPKSDNVLPLPETMLDMTGTAVVFWDDLGPDSLTPAQSTALSDWVRFGGQLIVNGATASDSLSKSVIGDLLPLTPTGNVELDPEAAAQLLDNWQVKSDRSTDSRKEMLNDGLSRIAVDGKLTDGAMAVENTENLIVEKRFGRGRVLQPRFDVTDAWVQGWHSYDSFINSVFLLRPRRKTIQSAADEETEYTQLYVDLGTKQSNASLNTQFRIAARDAVLNRTRDGKSLAVKQIYAYDKYSFSNPVLGVAAWSDDSDAIRMCTKVLRDESGIEIPDSSLVVRSLSYYLLILVPVNYLIFRLIGRLEYAWLAVPVIAIGGAMWVARAARLDIGFARSQTEMAFLEIQSDYERAHLSRVIAIYNSLSDSYNVQFKTFDAAARPIDDGSRDTNTDFRFDSHYAEGPALKNVAVGSNRVRMIHTEQLMDLGGKITYQNGQLLNGTNVEFLDAFVLEKDSDGTTRIATVGILSPQSSTKVSFEQRDSISVSEDLPMQADQVLRSIASPIAMPPGTMRLVARVDSTMPDMTITPNANQSSGQTIVLAHLKHAELPKPRPDVNLRMDMRRVMTGPRETNF